MRRNESHSKRVEWPTLALAALIYGLWIAITYWHARLPVLVLIMSGAWLVAWHSSLQHEIVHGHPTRSRAINTAIGYLPLALWLPFERYRVTHLTHHNDARLTDPLDDPESRYVTARDWDRLGPAGQTLLRAQTTLLGRLIIGPFWVVGRFYITEFTAICRGNLRLARVWSSHALAVCAVIAWIVIVCGMSPWFYMAAFVVPGTSLMLVRSFCEHFAAREIPHRTAVVEGTGPLALLFLFNNLHAAHHEQPQLPWYRLPRWYRDNRARLLAQNGGLIYRSYGAIFRRHLLKPYHQVLHPFDRAPDCQAQAQ
jgi:fatty acid desaturase